MTDWLSIAARRRGDHSYLVTPTATVGFEEADRRASTLAGGLLDVLPDGDGPVALWAGNDVPSVLAMFALWRTGAAVLLLDTRLTPAEASRQVARAGARALVGRDRPALGVPSFGIEGLTGPIGPDRSPEPGDLAWVVFTSGSTGEPKGVRLTFANLEASAAASAVHLDHRQSDRWLGNLPISHVGGASILIRSARQGSTVLLEPRFGALRTAALLRAGDATLASLVSATLVRTLEANPGRYTGVRAILVGGGPVPPDLVGRAHDAGLPVLATYGMTETASQIATARLEDAFETDPELHALPSAEVRTVDDRIEVRGPMVSSGYLGEPDRPGGDWLPTGDLGRVDGEGGLRVFGRADDVIVTGGENVHPAEVEAVVRELASVDEVCVLGVPDITWGQTVVAVYEGTAAAGELERHVRYRLAGFKVPRRWVRVDALPRRTIGKVDRSAAARLVG
jgi:O-succinylbenzoic acid--CoA ligase